MADDNTNPGGTGNPPPAEGTGNPPPAGGNNQPWFSSLPEGPVRDLMTTKAYDTPAKLADAYYNLNRLHAGSDQVIALPGEKATPEERAAFFNKVNGVPADVKGYDSIKVDPAIKVDEKFFNTAKGWFHETGVRVDQAEKLIEKWNGYIGEAVKQSESEKLAANQTAIAQIKAKYEAQGKGAYDQFLLNGQKAVQAFGLPEDLLNRLDAAHGVPATMELLAAIGAKIGGEGRFIAGEGGGSVNTPEAARVEIASLSADKAFQDSLLDAKHPLHAANTTKWRELQVKAYGKRQ